MRNAPRIALATVLALLIPSAVRAEQSIALAWNDCISQPGKAINVDYACDGSRNGESYRVVMTFRSPAALPAFIGIQMKVLVYTDEPILPDYWRLGAGECRDGNLVFPADLAGIGTGTTGTCRNPWVGANVGGGYQYTSNPVGPNYVYLNRAEILLAIARDTPVSLISGQRYIAGAFSLDTWSDVDSGTGACINCSKPMNLELVRVELYQEPGSGPPEVYFLSEIDTRITWQGGVQPIPTAARNATWGAVKALYR